MKKLWLGIVSIIVCFSMSTAYAADDWSVSGDGVLTFSENITEIPELEFFDKSDISDTITEIVVPDNVKTIGTGAFANCQKVKTVVLPEGLETIPENAFNADSALKSINIPSTVKKIDAQAFLLCSSIKTLGLPQGLESLGIAAFGSCKAMEGIVIPEKITVLPERLFNTCTALQYAGLPEGLKTVGESCFQFCDSLTEIYLPDTVEEIGASAFASSGLEKIYIPKSVTKIDAGAFAETKATIYGFAGSYAETYAADNSLEFEEIDKSMYSEPEFDVYPVSTDEEKIISVTSSGDGIAISADGKQVNFPDAKPFVDDADRTQIPIRGLSEMLGFDVSWNEATSSATITKDNIEITIEIGKNIITKKVYETSGITVSNEDISMDTAAMIVNDRTYVPLRFIAEALGYEVAWEH